MPVPMCTHTMCGWVRVHTLVQCGVGVDSHISYACILGQRMGVMCIHIHITLYKDIYHYMNTKKKAHCSLSGLWIHIHMPIHPGASL